MDQGPKLGGGALKGTSQNWASGMLPPKLGHILGWLALTEFFLAKNKTLPRSNHFLKVQWEIHFFHFLKYWPKLFKKKIRIEIWRFSFQICFQNQFLTSGSGRTENTQIRIFAYFSFDHFPKSKIYSKSRSQMRNATFLFKFFLLKNFGQY